MKKWNMVLVLAAISLLPVLPATVFAEEGAGLSLTLSADKSSAVLGENVTYAYFIANTGNVTVNNLELEDEKVGGIELPATELLAGDNITVYRMYTITDPDLSGHLVTSANVTGIDPDGQVISVISNSVSIALTAADDDETGNAELTIGLSADRESASVGDTITFAYLVSNTGNVTMDDLVIQHENVGTVSLTVPLLPGDDVTASGIYTVIEANLPGLLVTSANVTGIDPDDQVISATSNLVSITLTAEDDDSDDDDTGPIVRTKAWILRQLGVPGRGIDHAPGLQKEYNPNSNAARKLERFMERNTLRENNEVKVKNKNKNK